ncbi:hypothetical protein [Desulfocurvus sp. DL9XJH121]
MDPMTLIPKPDPIMLDWGWFQGLLDLTFMVHILLVNLTLGTAVVALFSIWSGQENTEPVGKDISVRLPTVIALTVNFGVAPLLFLQTLYGHFFYVSDILMGWYWLAVPFVVMASYYLAYIYDFSFASLGGARGLVIGLCVLCLLAVGFLFVNNLTLMMSPERWSRYFDGPGIFLNWSEPTLVPRYLHFVMASLAVGGLATALFYGRRSRRTAPLSLEHVERGMKWFFRCTVLQMVVGVWFLLALKKDVMLWLMGGSVLGTVFFLASLAGAGLCLYAGWRRLPRLALFAVVLTVVCMSGVREIVRVGYMGPYFTPTELEVVPQYSPLVMFLLALVLGLGIVAYVLGLARKAVREG